MSSEKVKFFPGRSDHFNTFLLQAMVDEEDKPAGVIEKFGLKPKQASDPEDHWKLDIEFKINGVECSLETYFHRILAEMDRHITEKAHELLQEKMRDFYETVSDLESFIKNKANEKLGYVKDEW